LLCHLSSDFTFHSRPLLACFLGCLLAGAVCQALAFCQFQLSLTLILIHSSSVSV